MTKTKWCVIQKSKTKQDGSVNGVKINTDGILINESYEEYRHFWYQMSTLCHLGPDITDGTHCPLCPEV